MKLILRNLFVYLALGFSCSMQDLHFVMQDLSLWHAIPHTARQSLNHWITREVLVKLFLIVYFI